MGGTVGGYISFAGGHRLLAGGMRGKRNVRYVNEGALTGIGLASIIRVMLFLAGLAVVVVGYKLDPSNPAASIFQYAAGNFGYKFFGLLLFVSGMSSVIGATFTSTSFLDYAVKKETAVKFKKYSSALIVGFIIFSTAIFYFIGNPAQMLVFAGAVNGFVLPIALAILLVASHKKRIMQNNYHHHAWLFGTGWLVVVFMAYAGIETVINLF